MTYSGALSGAHYLQGVRLVPSTRRAYAIAGGTPVYMVGGAPLDAQGRICYDVGPPVVFGTSGLGYSAARRLAVDTANAPNQFANGMSFFNGALCITPEAVLVLPGNFNLSGNAQPGINNITWTTSANATDYDVYKDFLFFKSYRAPSTGGFDIDIVPGNSYRYEVVARNEDGGTNSTPLFINLTAL